LEEGWAARKEQLTTGRTIFAIQKKGEVGEKGKKSDKKEGSTHQPPETKKSQDIQFRT